MRAAQMNNDILQITREHSWNYFALHAQQRISVFQYFITIETALITAAIISIQYRNDLNNPKWAIFMGPMIILFSFVFWKIDQRTRDLIQKAECSMQEIEKLINENCTKPLTLPFTEDPQNKPNVSFYVFPLFPGRLSYSQSFGIIYSTCALFGAILSFAMHGAFFAGK
jgi:hypothetical protein